jgi:hypothetical protein
MSEPKRGAVMIGVSKTGNLPQLKAAVCCAKKMGEWAIEQGFTKKLVTVITDEKRPVRAQRIIDAVDKILEEDGLEQIIVYFAGHGVNNARSEYWLLSEAPLKTAEAVNVDGSVDAARYVGVPYVVFISDACRTQAEGIQAGRVKGQEIFPNKPEGNPEQPVDIFFACQLGTPSLEIKDPRNSAAIYKAVYTEALLDALEGKCTDVIEEVVDTVNVVGFVRPRPLDDYLRTELAKRLAGVKTAEGPVSQEPLARLTSREKEAWIARFVEARVTRTSKGRPVRPREARVKEPVSIQSVAHSALRSALQGDRAEAYRKIDEAIVAQVSGASGMKESIAQGEPAYGPTHFETACGFKVRGANVVEAIFRHGTNTFVEIDPNDPTLVRVHNAQAPAASVLLRFNTRTGIVVPAIPQFLATISFTDGEVVSVSYEPSDGSPRWLNYVGNIEQFRTLRSVIAASAHLGVFRLHQEDAGALATQMQMSKNADPAMALYAAYTYYELRYTERLREMNDYQGNDLAFRLFDLAMLTRALNSKESNSEPNVFPAFPLLAQGWALLSAFGITLPPILSELQDHLVPSIWSVFDDKGIKMLHLAITSGAMK